MAENYKNESMVDVAYSVLKEKGEIIKFSDLFNEVASRLELTDAEKADNISNFYTGLSLDGRFVNLGDNEWDLRVNQTYDKVHIDMNDVYSDIEEETKANRDLEEFDHEEIEAEGLDEDLDDEDSDEDEEDYDRSSKEDL